MRQLHGQDPLTCHVDSLLAAARIYEAEVPSMGMQWMPTGIEDMPCRDVPIDWPAEVVVTCQADDASYFVYPHWALEPLATSIAFTSPAKRYVLYLKRKGVKAYYHLFTWIPRGNKYRAQHCAELPLFIGELEKWDRGWFTGDVTWQELQPMRAEFMSRLAAWIRR